MSAAKMTPAQFRMLSNLEAGRLAAYGLHGRSASGGATGTMVVLSRKGWINRTDGTISETGRAALKAAK